MSGVLSRVATGVLMVRGYDLGWRLEAALEALDQDRSQRTSAQV